MAGYVGVHQKLDLHNSAHHKSFQSAHNQFLAQAREMAGLKSENAKLATQVAEMGKVLNLVIKQTSHTSQLVAQSQSQGEAV